ESTLTRPGRESRSGAHLTTRSCPAGDMIVARGADVVLVAAKVEQGGRMKGSDLIELKVNSITVNGRGHSVLSGLSQRNSEGEGKKTGRKILSGAGLGAIMWNRRWRHSL